MQVDVERRRVPSQEGRRHARIPRPRGWHACSTRALWNSSVFSMIIVSMKGGDRRVKGEEERERSWTACIWDGGPEVRICQMDAGHHDYWQKVETFMCEGQHAARCPHR